MNQRDTVPVILGLVKTFFGLAPEFNKITFYSMEDVAKLYIDREGFSKFFPDSQFILEPSDSKPGYRVLRIALKDKDKNLPPLNQPTQLTVDQISKLFIRADGTSSLYPHHFFKVTPNEDSTAFTVICTIPATPLPLKT